MNTISDQQQTESSIFENGYDKEVILDDLKYGIVKTRKSIFIIGAIFLITDLFALSQANLLNQKNIIYVLMVPTIYAGLGFLSNIKPLLAIILSTLLFVGIISMSMIAFGASAILNGLLLKAVIIYFILTGFRNANDAEAARKKLELFR